LPYPIIPAIKTALLYPEGEGGEKRIRFGGKFASSGMGKVKNGEVRTGNDGADIYLGVCIPDLKY
jgi:hypothetical protein